MYTYLPRLSADPESYSALLACPLSGSGLKVVDRSPQGTKTHHQQAKACQRTLQSPKRPASVSVRLLLPLPQVTQRMAMTPE